MTSGTAYFRWAGLFLFLCVSLPTAATEPYQRAEVILKGALSVQVDLAITPAQRQLGLGGRELLDQGMLFVFDSPGEQLFWMKGMRIPIDILWLYNGRVVAIEHSVPPPSGLLLDSKLPLYGKGVFADSVLEVEAGFSRLHDISIGDTAEVKQ